MPLYQYGCNECGWLMDYRVSVENRDQAQHCPYCEEPRMIRRFTPTANILVPEHFRHDQSQFQPPAWDTAAWEARSKGHQSHAPAKAGEDFEKHLERDLRGSW